MQLLVPGLQTKEDTFRDVPRLHAPCYNRENVNSRILTRKVADLPDGQSYLLQPYLQYPEPPSSRQ